jgi:hypothetical protein
MPRQSTLDFRTEDEKPFVSDSKLSKAEYMAKYAYLNAEYMDAKYRWLHASRCADAAIIWANEVVPLFLKHHSH